MAMDKDHQYHDRTYQKDFMSKLSEYRATKQFTDITLEVDGTLFPCHKAVLSAGSEYFHNMFTSGMKESQEGLIELKGVDCRSIQTLIHYLYSGELIEKVNELDTIVPLLATCDQFQISGLMNLCEEFLMDKIDCYSAELLYLLSISTTNSLRQLEERVFVELRNHIVENALNASSEVLLSLSEELLIRILKDGNMKTDAEDIFYRLLWKWVDVEKQVRQERFQHILQHVRLPFCTPTFLANVVEKDSLMANVECQQILQEAWSFQKDIYRQHEFSSPRTIPRIFYPQRHILIIQPQNTPTFGNHQEVWLWKGGMDGSLMSPEIMGNFTDSWYGRRYTVKCPYMIVTTKSSVITRKISEPAESEEKVLLNVIRAGHCAVLENNHLFIFGGFDDEVRFHSTCECFEIVQKDNMGEIEVKKVENPPDMPLALIAACGIAFHGKVYIFGDDMEDREESRRTFEYDIGERKWSEKAMIPGYVASVSNEGSHVCLRIDENIYIIDLDVGCYLCYTPEQDVWQDMPKPVEKHENGDAVVWNGKILLIGGETETEDGYTVDSDTIEEYDPKSDSWSISNLKVPSSLMSGGSYELLNVLDVGGNMLS